MSIIEFPKMATVQEAAKLSHLPVYRIRCLYKEGKIRYVACGKRILINLSSLAEYLNSGDWPGEEPPPAPAIRRIK